jgi:hypothetical protein
MAIPWPFKVEQVPKSISEMVGEICRELAVLVLVFVPLELFKDTIYRVM